MKRILEFGGVATAVILVAFGVAAVVLGFNGKGTVSTSLKWEQITGSKDMTPAQIRTDAKAAGLKGVVLPTCNVANKAIDSGNNARCFAQYMRIHTLMSTGGYTYSQLGKYKAASDAPKSALAVGGGTDNPMYAATDPKTGQPVANGSRDLWITETALTTALNSAYMADQLGNFGIVVGVAFLLSGLGFGILSVGGALRTSTWFFGKRAKSAQLQKATPIGV